ncbi:MAG: DUF1353 domain-containing protein [Bacteroidetes bacterium]|nr:DUF1353 domain-containing protein [Bacteroidota bacterium]
MPSDPETLNRKAAELFTESLAQNVAEQVSHEAAVQAAAMQAVALEAAQGAAQGTAVAAPHSARSFFLADAFYAKLGMGHFTGHLSLVWNGMDSFIFISDPEYPLTYTTSAGRVLRPRIMETDGGSIPRILRGLQKFSSWGYAPAFIVHDWLFTAKKCGHAPDTDWTFPQSAEILAEAMKTLMDVGYTDYFGTPFRLEKSEDTLYLMYLAVRSPIAASLWNNDGSVRCMA